MLFSKKYLLRTPIIDMLLTAALIAACITLWHGCSSMPRYPEELTEIDSLCDMAPDSAAKALKRCILAMTRHHGISDT